MKRINIQVKVSYTVNLDCEVTEDTFSSLERIQDEFPFGMDNEDDITADKEVSKAFEWLNNACKEEDAIHWSFEIEDLNEE